MKLHLVRHGETEWNLSRRMQGRLDSPLTERGVSQSFQVQKCLSSTRIDRVYSSSSGRAVQTAKIICGQGQPINLMDDLREISLGTLEGLTKEYVQEHYPGALHAFWYKPSDFAVDGSETFADLRERVVSAVTKIIHQSDGQSVLIVSHAAAIKALLSHYLKKDIDQIWDPPALNNGAHIIMASKDRGTFHIALCENEHNEKTR